MNIFTSLPAGDSASWRDEPVVLRDGRRADATAWTLTYYLRGPSACDLVAAGQAQAWRTVLAASVSAQLTPGVYAWTAMLTNTDGERFTVAQGQLTVLPDPVAQVAGFDPRSQAQRALADCEAAMASFKSSGGKVKRYSIGGREMEFVSMTELLSLHSFWKARALGEGAASSIAQGLGNPRNLLVRFQHPQ